MACNLDSVLRCISGRRPNNMKYFGLEIDFQPKIKFDVNARQKPPGFDGSDDCTMSEKFNKPIKTGRQAKTHQVSL